VTILGRAVIIRGTIFSFVGPSSMAPKAIVAAFLYYHCWLPIVLEIKLVKIFRHSSPTTSTILIKHFSEESWILRSPSSLSGYLNKF
jgi:hypothetical protein